MKRRLLQFAALIAVAVLASACAPRKTGAGGSSPGDAVSVKGGSQRQNEQSSDPLTDSAPSTVPDVDTNSEARRSEVQVRAEDADTAPPGTREKPERPWAHNTGPSDPETLTHSGSLKITTDGAVLEDLEISGLVEINANNVTLRNFRIDASSWYGIRIEPGHSGIVVEDGEISGMLSAGILGAGFTARRLHIHDSGGDGLKVGGAGGPTVVESCFIEKLGRKADAHADGNQTRGGSNITFRYNNIYLPSQGTPNYPGAPYKSNAAFINSGTINNFVIDGNWLNGGNYTIYCKNTAGTGTFVRNNLFGRDNGGWSAGKDAHRLRAGSCAEWSGNRWEDTGEPI